MADGFHVNIEDVLEKTVFCQEKIIYGCEHYAKDAAQQMIGDAKKNAKWTDRTGMSRQTMDFQIVNNKNEIVIQIRGNTPQFKYLEFAMEKRFAILVPTMNKWEGKVLRGWSEVLNQL
ncbi:hypothetical protein phiCTP1_gp16 [Clostridium phage phiCTP1]|uniref:hypothetical protein n=1 Tax=Clostridium phage phiCTP1 TaxID=871584 RepID=UPI0001E0781E|nr:hypothetical protein phiCTP1_gp16 [Clostridium phage phiCTP1]ADL40317.1 hypothetical phage protein [Clostridium phage phiCTP1]